MTFFPPPPPVISSSASLSFFLARCYISSFPFHCFSLPPSVSISFFLSFALALWLSLSALLSYCYADSLFLIVFHFLFLPFAPLYFSFPHSLSFCVPLLHFVLFLSRCLSLSLSAFSFLVCFFLSVLPISTFLLLLRSFFPCSVSLSRLFLVSPLATRASIIHFPFARLVSPFLPLIPREHVVPLPCRLFLPRGRTVSLVLLGPRPIITRTIGEPVTPLYILLPRPFRLFFFSPAPVLRSPPCLFSFSCSYFIATSLANVPLRCDAGLCILRAIVL